MTQILDVQTEYTVTMIHVFRAIVEKVDNMQNE